MSSHNFHFCRDKMAAAKCPCLSCLHDKHVEDPETDTKCCDLIGHRDGCGDSSPCPDYEPEKGVAP